MLLDGADADPEVARDLRVAPAEGDAIGDGSLARGQLDGGRRGVGRERALRGASRPRTATPHRTRRARERRGCGRCAREVQVARDLAVGAARAEQLGDRLLSQPRARPTRFRLGGGAVGRSSGARGTRPSGRRGDPTASPARPSPPDRAWAVAATGRRDPSPARDDLTFQRFDDATLGARERHRPVGPFDGEVRRRRASNSTRLISRATVEFAIGLSRRGSALARQASAMSRSPSRAAAATSISNPSARSMIASDARSGPRPASRIVRAARGTSPTAVNP